MCRLCAFERNDDDATRCRQCGAEMAPIEDETEVEQDSAWFHYLNVAGIGTLELVPGRALQMGKDPRNELVIPKASQDQIATIFWTDDYDEATVRETGAPEGVKVDGVRITGTRTLKGGEEIVAGPLRMTYLRRAKPIKGAIDASKLGKKAPGAGHAVANQSPGTSAGKRQVVAANPAGVCVALEKTKATGTLRITSQRGRGWVAVLGGVPKQAAFGGLSGPSALLAILALPQGRCTMVAGVPKGKGPALSGTFSSIIAARQAKVEAQRKARPAVAARPPAARPPAARPGATPRPAAAPPRPGVPTPRPGAPAPRPGVPTARPGAPTPRPAAPTPRPGGPPRPGMPTPAPRPGQSTPRPGQRPPGTPPPRPPGR